MLQAVLGGMISAPAPIGPLSPNPAFGGWDRYLSEGSCFRTNRQRFLAYPKSFVGSTVAAAGVAPVDILTALLLDAGAINAAGTPVNAISMKEFEFDVASLDALAAVIARASKAGA